MKFDTAGFRLIRDMYAEGCDMLESRRCWACERIARSEKEAEMAKEGTFEWALGEIRQGLRVALPMGDGKTRYTLWLENGLHAAYLKEGIINQAGEEGETKQVGLIPSLYITADSWERCPWPACDTRSDSYTVLRERLEGLASEYEEEAEAIEARPEPARARFLRGIAADLRDAMRG